MYICIYVYLCIYKYIYLSLYIKYVIQMYTYIIYNQINQYLMHIIWRACEISPHAISRPHQSTPIFTPIHEYTHTHTHTHTHTVHARKSTLASHELCRANVCCSIEGERRKGKGGVVRRLPASSSLIIHLLPKRLRGRCKKDFLWLLVCGHFIV